jgi:hypothetical protein
MDSVKEYRHVIPFHFARILKAIWLPFVALLFSTALASPRSSAQTCSGPGTERWPIKVSVVAGADLSHPKTVDLNALLALQDPPGLKHNDSRFQNARIPAFSNSLSVIEGDILQTTGWLYLVATEPDCDYHIQISNQPRTTTDKPTPEDNCVVVEAPKPDFVDGTALKQAVITVRDYIKTKILKGNEPSNTGSVMIHPVCVRVIGQLFYDDAHLGRNGSKELRGKKGMHSDTLWELHPITDFQIVQSTACQP